MLGVRGFDLLECSCFGMNSKQNDLQATEMLWPEQHEVLTVQGQISKEMAGLPATTKPVSVCRVQ